MTAPKHCWCGAAVTETRGCFSSVLQCSGSRQHDPFDVAPAAPPRRLYIAGPMSGRPECNFPAFYRAAYDLGLLGYDTVNPADNDTGASYREILAGDIALMLTCDGVATLDEWWLSPGARLEVTIAGVLQKPVRSTAEWLRRPAPSSDTTQPEGAPA